MSHNVVHKLMGEIEPFKATFDNRRFQARYYCECGNNDFWSANSMPRPDVAITKATTKARKQGWTVNKKELFCPRCSAIHKKERDIGGQDKRLDLQEVVVAAPKPKPTPTPKAPPPPPVQAPTPIPKEEPMATTPTPDDKALKRSVYAALLDNYDEVNKRYRPDWNDERIARETKASPVFVAKLREEDFGPIGTPPEVEELFRSLGILKAKQLTLFDQLSAIENEMGKLATRIDTAATKHGWII